MIELLFADCNCQSLTKKFPLRCQKFPHSSQISSQISVGFANFVDMGRPLSERVAYSRWKMFGHILRSTSNSPAVCSLFFAVNSMRDMKGRVGRHQCNLLKTLKNDLSDRDIKLVNTEDIYNLIFLAQDRLKWRKLF